MACDRHPLKGTYEVSRIQMFGHTWELRWCQEHEAWHVWKVTDE
jgi:hypothetical protein